MTAQLEKELASLQNDFDVLQKEYQEFAYAVSHDLGAPFRQIDGFTKIIAKNNSALFDQKTSQQFNLITKGTKKGMAIVDMLLDFSRLNTRTQPFAKVDTNELIANVITSFDKTIDRTKAKIGYDSLPNIIGDKQQLHQLFYQLIDNALRYQTKDNVPHIAISSHQTDGGWEFDVTDNGIGINENANDRIFKVLQRGVTSMEYPGSGMGLAIARKIVKRHGGDIYAKPAEGDGSIFTFTILTA